MRKWLQQLLRGHRHHMTTQKCMHLGVVGHWINHQPCLWAVQEALIAQLLQLRLLSTLRATSRSTIVFLLESVAPRLQDTTCRYWQCNITSQYSDVSMMSFTSRCHFHLWWLGQEVMKLGVWHLIPECHSRNIPVRWEVTKATVPLQATGALPRLTPLKRKLTNNYLCFSICD